MTLSSTMYKSRGFLFVCFLSCPSASSLSIPLCLAHNRFVDQSVQDSAKSHCDSPTFCGSCNLCSIHLSQLVNSLPQVTNYSSYISSLEISLTFAEKCAFLSSWWADIRETGNWSNESFSLLLSPQLPLCFPEICKEWFCWISAERSPSEHAAFLKLPW